MNTGILVNLNVVFKFPLARARLEFEGCEPACTSQVPAMTDTPEVPVGLQALGALRVTSLLHIITDLQVQTRIPA